MSLARTIASRASGTYTVTRRARPSVVNGRAVEGAVVSTFAIVASVQPASSRDAGSFPEGTRVTDNRTVWTATALIGCDSPDYVADEITIPTPAGVAETYAVHAVATWQTRLETFWVAYVSRVSQR